MYNTANLSLEKGKGGVTNDKFRVNFAISRNAFERKRRNYESKTRRTKGLVHNSNKVDFTGLSCFLYKKSMCIYGTHTRTTMSYAEKDICFR